MSRPAPEAGKVTSFFQPLFTTYSLFFLLLSSLFLIAVLRRFNQRPSRRLKHSPAFPKSLCMIKFCCSTPDISVFLAARPACDQAAANLLETKTPLLMSCPKRFKSSPCPWCFVSTQIFLIGSFHFLPF